MIENLGAERRRECLFFTMLASEMWSMLATSIAMATFTGGPAEEMVRKKRANLCPPHLKHPPTPLL